MVEELASISGHELLSLRRVGGAPSSERRPCRSIPSAKARVTVAVTSVTAPVTFIPGGVSGGIEILYA
jgi:hypothetical protein